jgi:hypothetical protein
MRQTFLQAAACVALLFAARAAHAQPTIETYWPHEDGRQWTYDQRSEQLWPTGELVDTHARLFFDGTTTAAGGIAAQFLNGSVASLPARARSSGDAPVEVADPFLRRLWLARPDLRPGILSTAAAQPCPHTGVAGWDALLLSGRFAYLQTASEAAAWRCDLESTQSWLWLTSNLSPGSTASLQLVPDLADDVYLDITVVGTGEFTVPAGTFQDCLHVAYVIDYGLSQCTDEFGYPVGTVRDKTTGYVRYAPGVGPIESYEEFAAFEQTGTCPGPTPGYPIARVRLAMNAPSVPALASSWGKLKAAYR